MSASFNDPLQSEPLCNEYNSNQNIVSSISSTQTHQPMTSMNPAVALCLQPQVSQFLHQPSRVPHQSQASVPICHPQSTAVAVPLTAFHLNSLPANSTSALTGIIFPTISEYLKNLMFGS